MNLHRYGLDDFFLKQINNQDIPKLAKIVATQKKGFTVLLENNLKANAVVKGSKVHQGYIKSQDLPKVGDFVILASEDDQKTHQDIYFITKVLERKNSLKRRLAGDKIEEQIIATNIDYVFITLPSDEQFNLKRVERMIVASQDAGIIPIIVITKNDLLSDKDAFEKQVKQHFQTIKIISTSFLDSNSIDEIKDILKDNKVGVFIGNSGAGKSTLTNMLLNEEIQKTSEVSELESKGKHTTTHRELFLLETGGVIIDNPGIKEFGLWLENESSLNTSFKDIIEYAKGCKFNDCRHDKEPNCMVKQAIKEGNLSQNRLDNYFKLKQEEEASFLAKNIHEKRKKNNKAIKVAKENKMHYKHKK